MLFRTGVEAMQIIQIKDFKIGPRQKLAFICGPCVMESEEHAFSAAAELKKIFQEAGINLIFKASFDKANRSSIDSFRGPGPDEGLRILSRIKRELDLPVLTDVHAPEQAARAAEVCDILQIPAFLCRQTDLIVACADTGAAINVKKGQFLAPWDMENIIRKIESRGNKRIISVDRGTCFGYNNLVSDMRAIPIMQRLGYPVCFDASHSVQLPGGNKTTSGGQREFIPVLAKAAVAAGCNLLFMEAHPNPEKALSDAATVFPFRELPRFLREIQKLYETVQSFDV